MNESYTLTISIKYSNMSYDHFSIYNHDTIYLIDFYQPVIILKTHQLLKGDLACSCQNIKQLLMIYFRRLKMVI